MDTLRTYTDAIIVITGGASGLGKQIGIELAQRGAIVMLLDRQIEEAEHVCSLIQEKGGRSFAYEVDVRNPTTIKESFRRIYTEHGRIDYVFNNAGIMYAGNVTDMEPDQWENIVDVNIKGVVYGCREAAAIMKEQGFGHIVNTASMAGLLITPFIAAYGMTKYAVVGLSLALNSELKTDNICVTAICPGFINTPILHGGRYGSFVSKPNESELKKLQKNNLVTFDVESFAKAAVKQIPKRKGIIILPRRWNLMWCLQRWFPRLSLRLSQMSSRYAIRKKLFGS
ncbi:MAG: SDR family oxidoreductase [Myxococcota bacterium]|nr:SDR family oxidoreductase [Myxococcota bacterium]